MGCRDDGPQPAPEKIPTHPTTPHTPQEQVVEEEEVEVRDIYAANVGDSRAVLCHRGKGVRLTYDHKADDGA